MKSRFLFPYKWRIVGIVLFIVGLVASLVGFIHHSDINTDISRELATDVLLLTLIVGLLLIAFTKEKIEDEHIAQLRLDSLQWAIYFNYAVLILCIVFVSNWHLFINIATHYIFTPLIFFIIRFRWVVYQSNRALKVEE